VLYALRLGRPGRVLRDGLIMAGLVVWQFFINQEVLLITAVALGVVTLIRIRDVWPKGPRILGSLGITAVVAGALLAYPMWFQFRGPQSYRGLPFEFHSWGEDLAAYVTFARDTLAGDEYVEKVIGHTEQNTWFGWRCCCGAGRRWPGSPRSPPGSSWSPASGPRSWSTAGRPASPARGP
jgi:hypothetical protein